MFLIFFSIVFPRARDVPPEVLRQREVKWLDMLSHWDKWMIKRFNKVGTKCQLSDTKCQLAYLCLVVLTATWIGQI